MTDSTVDAKSRVRKHLDMCRERAARDAAFYGTAAIGAMKNGGSVEWVEVMAKKAAHFALVTGSMMGDGPQ